MNRITKKEFEWYDDFVTSVEDEYDIDEVNDVIYRKLKELEDIEEELGINLFTLINNFKKDLEILECFKKIPKQDLKEFIECQIRYEKNLNTWLEACNADLAKEEPTKHLIKIKEWLENE